MAAKEQEVSIRTIRERSPFPWTQQFNFDGRGGLRLVDAAGNEVPLFSIVNLACIITAQVAAQAHVAKQEQQNA